VNPALAGLTCVVAAGAVTAVSAREPRVALLGLLVALLGAPLIADPLPGPLSIAARIVAAVLASQLIAIAIRSSSEPTSGSRLGWPVEALAAAAGIVIGFGAHGLGAPGEGPAEAQAAGFAVGVLAVVPIVTGRDVVRLGVGSVLLLTSALLVRQGLDGTPSELEQLATSLLLVGLGGAIGAIVLGARASGGLGIQAEAAGRRGSRIPVRRHVGPEAHPVAGHPPGAHPIEPRGRSRWAGASRRAGAAVRPGERPAELWPDLASTRPDEAPVTTPRVPLTRAIRAAPPRTEVPTEPIVAAPEPAPEPLVGAPEPAPEVAPEPLVGAPEPPPDVAPAPEPAPEAAPDLAADAANGEPPSDPAPGAAPMPPRTRAPRRPRPAARAEEPPQTDDGGPPPEEPGPATAPKRPRRPRRP
jgi:hypothetical protein